MTVMPRTQRYTGLVSEAYEHPEDRMLLNTVKRIKILDTVMKFISEHSYERRVYMENISSTVRVSPRQHPRLYRLYKEAVLKLDMPEPELFVKHGHGINAYATGSQRPWIVIHADLLHHFNDREVQFVLAHELGHVKSGHVLYMSMMRQMAGGALTGLKAIPMFGGLVEQALQQGAMLALQRWSQKAEFTADRAAALVTLDPELSVMVSMKLAGAYVGTSQYNVDEFIRQADEFEELSDSMAGRVYNLMNSAALESHPYPALRAKALRTWHGSDQLRGLLSQYAENEQELALLPGACPSCQAHVPHLHVSCQQCGNAVERETVVAPAFRHHCEQCQWPHDDQDAFCLGCGVKLSRNPVKGGGAKPVVDTSELPFQSAYLHPEKNMRPASSTLKGNLAQAVHETLGATEHLRYEVLTTPGQALVFTDQRVLVVKAGMIAGGLNARRVFSYPWSEVLGLETRYLANTAFAYLQVRGAPALAVTDVLVAAKHPQCSQVQPGKLPEVGWLASNLQNLQFGELTDSAPVLAPSDTSLNRLPGALGTATEQVLYGERIVDQATLAFCFGLTLTPSRVLLSRDGELAGGPEGGQRVEQIPDIDVERLEIMHVGGHPVLQVVRKSSPTFTLDSDAVTLARQPGFLGITPDHLAELEELIERFQERRSAGY